MVSINLVCVGSLKEKYLKDACNEYIKRLSRFCKLQVVEIDESTPEKEMVSICKKIEGYVIALCIEGNKISSEEFSEKLKVEMLRNSKFTFIIGGSAGLDEKVKKSADLQLSFSEMTFPHQLMRVFLLEQVYRAFTIINGITYHK
ncbi:MAG: rlmH [Clostridia bacterium]|jgi:23S rRNA (pseudouridine1915-N3)-methyltransferase|nr:rlmH [Clostridia bacterium]